MPRHSAWGLSSTSVMDWRVGAACRATKAPDAWIMKKSKPSLENEVALRICRTCPVMDQCRGWYESLAPEMRQSVIAGGVHYNSSGRPSDEARPPPRAGVVSTGQAAYALRVSRQTVINWCATGLLPAVRDDRGRWVIRAEDLTPDAGVMGRG